MTQNERCLYLIQALSAKLRPEERPQVPDDPAARKQLLRALFNVRMPALAEDSFLAVQDAYLQEELRRKGITDFADLTPVRKGLYLWQGDITTLKCDAIVNAANSGMLGCFVPCHRCIDNAIHTFSGIRLRYACAQQMQAQGHEEPVGSAKITPAFNLPSRYILHTVGPFINGFPDEKDCAQLASCYTACLSLCARHPIDSIAFCCISTGEFHFPNETAARIAVTTVKSFKEKTGSDINVIFNVFKDEDYDLYRKLL